MKSKFCLILLCIFTVKCEDNFEDNEIESDPIVEIPNGKLRGNFGTNLEGLKIYQFKGIPYGKVIKRFSESEEITEKWEKTRNAQEFGPICKQMNLITRQIMGNEDCLSLNVYSRNINPEAKLPVMVFIHGGILIFGASDIYDPKYLLSEDLVVVTINYRLGPLGFLNAGVKSAPGNMGFKDQRLALKWVQKNIKFFGGDPNKVTIFGESAGAGSVQYQVISPSSKGLFSRAIAQSGSTFAPWAWTKNPLINAKKLAQNFDCPTSNLEFMVECLQRIDDDLLVQTMNESMNFESNIGKKLDLFFTGSRETYLSSNTFLADDPENIFEKQEFNKVPILMGANFDEGLFFTPPSILTDPIETEKWNSDYDLFFPQIFKFKKEALNRCGLSEKLWREYFTSGKVSLENPKELSNLLSDFVINNGVRRSAKFHAKNGGSVYLYHFSMKLDNSFAQLLSMIPHKEGELFDSTHGDEMQFFFKMDEYIPGFKETKKFRKDFKRIIKLWTSFAKNGKPTELWGDKLKEWPQFDPNEPKWIDINDENIQELKESEIFGNRFGFWDEFYDKIY